MEKEQNISILVVDDNLVNQKVAELILRKMNFVCDFANNGEEAYLKYKEKEYDIVLMDIQMPVLDGIDSMRKIRDWEAEKTSGKKASIFAITAGNQLGDEIVRYKDLGFDGFIGKPLHEKKLFEVISKFK